MQALEPSARVPVCSCGAVNQMNAAKREQGTGTEPGKNPGKHSTTGKEQQWCFYKNIRLKVGGVRRTIKLAIKTTVVNNYVNERG